MTETISYEELIKRGLITQSTETFECDDFHRFIVTKFLQERHFYDITPTTGFDHKDIICKYTNDLGTVKVAIECKDRSIQGRYYSYTFGDNLVEHQKIKALSHRYTAREFDALILCSLFTDGIMYFTTGLETNQHLQWQGYRDCPSHTVNDDGQMSKKYCVSYYPTTRVEVVFNVTDNDPNTITPKFINLQKLV